MCGGGAICVQLYITPFFSACWRKGGNFHSLRFKKCSILLLCVYMPCLLHIRGTSFSPFQLLSKPSRWRVQKGKQSRGRTMTSVAVYIENGELSLCKQKKVAINLRKWLQSIMLNDFLLSHSSLKIQGFSNAVSKLAVCRNYKLHSIPTYIHN